ncbi:MAG TPA: UDP-4-amino-4,6-dideoxy-N-acetyl-beta-L-altrosamine N-acetyltransferase [Dongiaceae bacterium]|nr:UDP-4-amino-4,6-dideoxy-N-acetyl-beta-L-altrosamine N-acetyltransferase [Dongiaceae bacterium]
MMLGQQRVRPMTTDDLQQVLAWRNHEAVRRFMLTQHEISLAEHIQWFARASRDDGRHLLIFETSTSENDSDPLGFVSFQALAQGGVAEWGFYVAPGAPRGTGSQMGQTALQYAFDALGFDKVEGQALAHNESSIRFHVRMGFTQEGVLRRHHFDGARYHDLICFGLLANEWQLQEGGTP